MWTFYKTEVTNRTAGRQCEITKYKIAERRESSHRYHPK
jgi:hypothetical protein